MKATTPATDHLDNSLKIKLKTIREENKPQIKRIALHFLPFVFMIFMTVLALAPMFFKVGEGIPSSLVAFVCFLPIAFLFVANASYTEISGLEARIRDLEKKKAEQASPANHRLFGTSGMASANSAARAEAMPEANGDS